MNLTTSQSPTVDAMRLTLRRAPKIDRRWSLYQPMSQTETALARARAQRARRLAEIRKEWERL